MLALLDLEFKDDLSCYRAGHGAKNIAVVTVNLDSVPCMSAFDNLAVGLTIVLFVYLGVCPAGRGQLAPKLARPRLGRS